MSLLYGAEKYDPSFESVALTRSVRLNLIVSFRNYIYTSRHRIFDTGRMFIMHGFSRIMSQLRISSIR